MVILRGLRDDHLRCPIGSPLEKRPGESQRRGLFWKLSRLSFGCPRAIFQSTGELPEDGPKTAERQWGEVQKEAVKHQVFLPPVLGTLRTIFRLSRGRFPVNRRATGRRLPGQPKNSWFGFTILFCSPPSCPSVVLGPSSSKMATCTAPLGRLRMHSSGIPRPCEACFRTPCSCRADRHY